MLLKPLSRPIPWSRRTLLSKIPKMGAVALIVAQQHAPLPGVPEDVDGMPRNKIIIGGEILRLAVAYEDLTHRTASNVSARQTKLDGVTTNIRDLQDLEAELKADLGKCNRALKQNRGKTCACPVLEEVGRTNNV